MMMVRMKVFFVIGVGVAVPSILATATRTTLGQLKKCREAFSSMTKAAISTSSTAGRTETSVL